MTCLPPRSRGDRRWRLWSGHEAGGMTALQKDFLVVLSKVYFYSGMKLNLLASQSLTLLHALFWSRYVNVCTLTCQCLQHWDNTPVLPLVRCQGAVLALCQHWAP